MSATVRDTFMRINVRKTEIMRVNHLSLTLPCWSMLIRTGNCLKKQGGRNGRTISRNVACGKRRHVYHMFSHICYIYPTDNCENFCQILRSSLPKFAKICEIFLMVRFCFQICVKLLFFVGCTVILYVSEVIFRLRNFSL